MATATSDSSGQVKTDAQPATLIEMLEKQLELFTTQLTSLSNQFDEERKDYLKRGNKARVLYWFLGWPSALLATITGITAIAKQPALTTIFALSTAALSTSLNIFRPAATQASYYQACDDLNSLTTKVGAIQMTVDDAVFALQTHKVGYGRQSLDDLQKAPSQIRAQILAIAAEYDAIQARAHSNTTGSSPNASLGKK